MASNSGRFGMTDEEYRRLYQRGRPLNPIRSLPESSRHSSQYQDYSEQASTCNQGEQTFYNGPVSGSYDESRVNQWLDETFSSPNGQPPQRLQETNRPQITYNPSAGASQQSYTHGQERQLTAPRHFSQRNIPPVQSSWARGPTLTTGRELQPYGVSTSTRRSGGDYGLSGPVAPRRQPARRSLSPTEEESDEDVEPMIRENVRYMNARGGSGRRASGHTRINIVIRDL